MSTIRSLPTFLTVHYLLQQSWSWKQTRPTWKPTSWTRECDPTAQDWNMDGRWPKAIAALDLIKHYKKRYPSWSLLSHRRSWMDISCHAWLINSIIACPRSLRMKPRFPRMPCSLTTRTSTSHHPCRNWVVGWLSLLSIAEVEVDPRDWARASQIDTHERWLW